MFEALTDKITMIADDCVKPIFKLPLAGNDEGAALQGPTQIGGQPKQLIRARTTVVGDAGTEPVTSSVSANVQTGR